MSSLSKDLNSLRKKAQLIKTAQQKLEKSIKPKQIEKYQIKIEQESIKHLSMEFKFIEKVENAWTEINQIRSIIGSVIPADVCVVSDIVSMEIKPRAPEHLNGIIEIECQ